MLESEEWDVGGAAAVVEYGADHFGGFDVAVVGARCSEVAGGDFLGVDEVQELLLVSMCGCCGSDGYRCEGGDGVADHDVAAGMQ